MKADEMIKILQTLPPEAELFVEAAPDKDYDRTCIIKIVKRGKEYVITDVDSEYYKSNGI